MSVRWGLVGLVYQTTVFISFNSNYVTVGLIAVMVDDVFCHSRAMEFLLLKILYEYAGLQ